MIIIMFVKHLKIFFFNSGFFQIFTNILYSFIYDKKGFRDFLYFILRYDIQQWMIMMNRNLKPIFYGCTTK